jgi:ribose transport system substrate-binding protein
MLNRLGISALVAASISFSYVPAFAESKGTIAYLLPDSGGPFYPDAGKILKEFLQQEGYDLTILDSNNKSDVQLNQIDNVINLKPKAIIVAAVDFDAVVPGVEKAKAAGIPTIAFDRQIKGTTVGLTSVAGAVEIGQIAADQAADLLKARYGQVKGNVLEITGDPGDAYSVSLREGFDGKMKAFPDVKLVTKPAMQWEPTNAANVAQDQLQAVPNTDLIFYHSGYLASAVTAVVQAGGKKAGEVMMIDGDGDPGGLTQIRAGWQQVSVQQPMPAQVYAIAMFLDKVLKGEQIKPGKYDVLGLEGTMTNEKWGPNLKIPGSVITKANVDGPSNWGNGKVPQVMIFIFVIFSAILRKTPFGRYLYLLGGNAVAPFRAGIPVVKVAVWAFVISGLLSAFAGWLLAARTAGATANLGVGMIFEAFAAVVIGGVSLKGGVGSLPGVFAGVLLLTSIRTAINLLGMPPQYTQMIQGALVLAAMTLDSFKQIIRVRYL